MIWFQEKKEIEPESVSPVEEEKKSEEKPSEEAPAPVAETSAPVCHSCYSSHPVTI